MQAVFAYVGDAVSAAGFRLGGARTFTPAPGEEAAALAQACRTADLVLLSDDVAAALPHAELNALLAALQPMAAIVPRWREALSVRDPGERVRAQLGLDQQS
jgi:vacuolar-type H+-ATPase subunit F/Vma7